MLADLDRDGADENWAAPAMDVFDLSQRRAIFFAFGLVNRIVSVSPSDRFVGRNDQHPKFVDIEKLGGFRLGGARHAGEFLIETKIVLNRNGRQRLGFALD